MPELRQAALPLASPSRGPVFTARSILVRTKIPGMDVAINPYVGCSYGCGYCYAAFMGRSVGRGRDEWGRYVYPKENLRAVLRRELRRPRNGRARIFFGSVTDPWQPAEARWKLTRAALELLAEHRHRGRVQVLTRSKLVCRDIDLLERLNSDVGLTISPDGGLTRLFDRRSPPLADRLEALTELNVRGLRTYAFIGPLFPVLLDEPGALEQLFAGVAAAGTREVYVAHGRISPEPLRRWLALADEPGRERLLRYLRRPDPEHKRRVEERVGELLREHRLRSRTDSLIDH
jgi:DNA repair photolyase